MRGYQRRCETSCWPNSRLRPAVVPRLGAGEVAASPPTATRHRLSSLVAYNSWCSSSSRFSDEEQGLLECRLQYLMDVYTNGGRKPRARAEVKGSGGSLIF